MSTTDTPVAGTSPRTGWASLRDLTGYQWFVFIVCCLAWDMDCMDQQLFVLARRPAMTDLVAKVKADDARLPEFAKKLTDEAKSSDKPIPSPEAVRTAIQNADIGAASGYATSFFMLGWAVGGIGFGIMGDRVGRVKTLMLTILLYAIFTGLSALSTSTLDFYLYRFLTGLGVGGVFAAAVTLLAETMPNNARPFALGMFQASSVIGNCTAALVSMKFGSLQEAGFFKGLTLFGEQLTPWKMMFLIGIIPGLLVVLIQARLKEPEKWKQMVAAGGKKGGSYGELLGDNQWRSRALFGLVLALAGVVGLWAIAFFSPDLQQYVAEPAYKTEAIKLGLATEEQVQQNQLPADAQKYVNGQKAYWAGITSLVQNMGAFFGIFAFSWVTPYIGRKPAFAIFLVMAGLSTAMVFLFLKEWSDILWMVPIMGFFQLALFGGYAIYLPELFPTRLRSTGTSFCYNVGRLVSALGPTLLSLLTSQVYSHFPAPEPLRYAGVTMCSIFLLGLIVLPFLPETKGKPLPE
ncbi:MFS transporter [Fimbriiglobus ruber]|uniref:Putative 4-methylmuconolactone Major Facilitator Family (MFS) transporter n=1 Tax=Fimbriiglobus ruber TaxID=1908690 RepID=A0A225DBQ6_9BACT|nr:MFS transporter [Fimbriiglobus ruber]OWK35958.1 putative 4-methylmuconolactone Major Facilitator Family (MFS) transporter [Fimbriiglobus ruber]